MARQIYQIPGFNGVAPGATGAQASLATGNQIYDSISLKITKNGALVALADLATDIREIRIIADSRIIRRISPALLLSYLQSKGLTNVLANGAGTAVLSAFIPFTDPTRPEVMGQEATALGTADVNQLLVQLDFQDPGGAPVYAVSGVAQVRNGAKSVRMVETWQMESFTTANGVVNLNTLTTVDDYLGLLLQLSTITRIRVTVDNNTVFDCYKADIEALMRANGYGTLTANYFPVPWDVTRQLTDALAMTLKNAQGQIVAKVSTFNVEITATAAATISILRRNLWVG